MGFKTLQSRWHLIEVILVAIACLASGGWAIALVGKGAAPSPIWLPAGIALAALLLWGEGVWWGILWGDLLLMLLTGAGVGLALGSAVGSTAAAILAFRLLKYAKFSLNLERIRDVAVLLILAAVISPMVNATIDIAVRVLAGKLAWSDFGREWWVLWLGDCTGILLVTPLLLRLKLASRGLLQRQRRQRLWEGASCLGLLGAIGWLVFDCERQMMVVAGQGLANTQYLEYLPVPFAVWAAIRFQTWGAALASLLLSSLAIAGTLRGIGPFAVQAPNLNQAILLLQMFVAIVTATTLLLSAAVSERQRAEKQLRATLERDRLLGEIALRIRQSLDLDEIFQAAVAEIRQLLDADRVHLGYLEGGGQGSIVAESVASGYPSLLGRKPQQELVKELETFFSQQDVLIADNVCQLQLSPLLREYYARNQVQAALAVPLQVNHQLLGLLVAHQCSRPRHWQKGEVRLLEQLATQVAIAIQQAQLYRQVQSLNSNLERQVAERTRQLQEKVEEVQRLYEMKTAFLQAVSHDLRTSILGLSMLLKNLQNRPGDNIALSRSILDRIVKSGDRQLTLIDALSEGHFTEGHPLLLNCQSLSLKDLVQALVEDWQLPFAENQASLTSDLPDHLPPTWADPLQLRCAFEHLLTNALKHNPPGITLNIGAQVEGEMLRCTLTDDGVGMTPQQCQQLFKLYVRSLHNPRLTGVGLGSYQCRQIIQSHGGQIGINSQPGQGSQFWFTLPLALPAANRKLLSPEFQAVR